MTTLHPYSAELLKAQKELDAKRATLKNRPPAAYKTFAFISFTSLANTPLATAVSDAKHRTAVAKGGGIW